MSGGGFNYEILILAIPVLVIVGAILRKHHREFNQETEERINERL